MLDILKSKMMIIFVMLVLGVIFIDCSFNNTMDDNNNNFIVLNS